MSFRLYIAAVRAGAFAWLTACAPESIARPPALDPAHPAAPESPPAAPLTGLAASSRPASDAAPVPEAPKSGHHGHDHGHGVPR